MAKRKPARVVNKRPLPPKPSVKAPKGRAKSVINVPATRRALMSADSSIARSLKEAVASSGQPLEDVAKRADITQKVLARFLAGKRDIQLSTASRLAEVLDLKFGKGR